jgi:hypothetical protein
MLVVPESCAVLLAGLVLGDLRFEFESDMEGMKETSPKSDSVFAIFYP